MVVKNPKRSDDGEGRDLSRLNRSKRLRRASIEDVARLSGVSRQTVSRVINESGYVADATRERVQAAIAQLGYQPSQTARALATSHTRMIGVIAGGINYYGPISTISALGQTAREYGYSIVLANVDERKLTEEDFRSVVTGFRSLGVEAYVLVAPTDAIIRAIKRMEFSVPCVIVTGSDGAENLEEWLRMKESVMAVGIDQWNAMHRISQICLSQSDTVYYFSGPLAWRDAYTRQKAIIHAYEDGRAEKKGELFVIPVGSWEAEAGYDQAVKLLSHLEAKESEENHDMVCLVCANDLLALGVLRAISEKPWADVQGKRLRNRYFVCGYDDMPGSDNAQPPLTTVHPDFHALGVLAIQLILSRLDPSDGGHQASVDALNASQRCGVWQIPASVAVRHSLTPGLWAENN